MCLLSPIALMLSTFVFACLTAPVSATEHNYTFLVNEPGAPPYIYLSKNKDKYVGIVPDLFAEIAKNESITVAFKPYNRFRGELAIGQNKADMMLVSKAWVKSSDNFLFSEPLLQHRSFLYQRQAFANNFSLATLPNNTKICTRRVYAYPVLQTYFDRNHIERVDSASQITMLKMLFANRCDMAILNEYAATALMNLDEFNTQQLHASPQFVSQVPLNIALRKSLASVKQILDKHIQQLKQNGKLTEIISYHTTNHNFGQL